MNPTDPTLRLAAWMRQFGAWEGSLAEFAGVADRIHRDLSPADFTGDGDPIANVRLLRHYLTTGVLSRGERRGRDGIYGLRHLLEYLAARALLRDGWPLAKIAAFAARASDAELAALLPPPGASQGRPRTRAQDLVARFRNEPRASASAPAPTRSEPMPVVRSPTAEPKFSIAEDRSFDFAELFDPVAARQAPIEEVQPLNSAPLIDPVAARLATHTRDRQALEAGISSRPESLAEPASVRRTLTIEPVPWCRLTIDEAALAHLDEKGLHLLIDRLRRALRDARRHQGETDDPS